MGNKLTLTSQEIANRDKLSEYVRKNIFYYTDEEPTPPYFWQRILALKSGKFQVRGGLSEEKVFYTFEQILIVFIMCKTEIDSVLNRMTFNDENHKINTVLKIINANMIPIMRMIQDRKEKEKKEPKQEDIDKFSKSNDNYVAKEEELDKGLEEFF